MKRIESINTRRIHPGDSDNHDLCLSTRKPSRVLLKDLSNYWGNGGDKAEQDLALFLYYNKHSFTFLLINVILPEDGTPCVIFQPSERVGCAPLISPKNGKICASIIVRGNMNEDVSEIIPLVEGNVNIEFSERLKLSNNTAIRPPLYFECAKYIEQYIVASRLHWKKFVSELKFENIPASSTQWGKYASTSYDPQKVLKYPNKKNLLFENHSEWKELNFVLKMCLDEFDSNTTPRRSKNIYKEKISDLRRNIDLKNVTKPVLLKIHAADPLEIKKLKAIGNRILHSITSESYAWYVDFSRLFEAYVQYIFSIVSLRIGAGSYNNQKLAVSGGHRSWTLAYLEPDVLLKKGDVMVVADAKYKMHLYNTRSESVDSLYEAFRHDLHQVLAYASFERDVNKTAMIVYPCWGFTNIRQIITNPISSVVNKVYLIGIPWGDCQENEKQVSIQEKVRIAVEGIVNLINSKN